MKTLLAIHEVDEALTELSPVIDIARRTQAHLNVVVLGIVQVIPVTAAPGIPAFYYNESNNEMIEAGQARVKEIDALMAKEGIPATVSLECRDPSLIEQTLLRLSLTSDAAVFPNQTVLATDLNTRAFNGALLDTGKPVIVLGTDSERSSKFQTVLMAWNGEPESAKAIHQSLSWLPQGATVHVVMIDPDDLVQGRSNGEELAAYLNRHDLTVTIDRLPSGRRPTSDVILEHARDIDADLIVMGAYGHSRLREWLMGGTTRAILEKADRAVLMAH